ncbi:hypothetical protein [Haloterrigena alkaliphila]|uniref:hypothetical protein n=1 Tax=Haloterrigena alkaliphila TaxID=2816475 RepID=UPI001CFF80D5|nr:hypothetical protein [Haloterrigena alkaliphila]UHQ95076.1 hypothetical protein J0X25_19665 [Haloterrigena alkaliphila]
MTDSSDVLDSVEFPSDAPRDGCFDAIAAAREYIHEHDGATKDEIMSDLVPEENYPLGHNGVAASAKGFTTGFRDWWWGDIVAPGLRALPDIDAPEVEGRLWLPTDQDDH